MNSLTPLLCHCPQCPKPQSDALPDTRGCPGAAPGPARPSRARHKGQHKGQEQSSRPHGPVGCAYPPATHPPIGEGRGEDERLVGGRALRASSRTHSSQTARAVHTSGRCAALIARCTYQGGTHGRAHTEAFKASGARQGSAHIRACTALMCSLARSTYR